MALPLVVRGFTKSQAISGLLRSTSGLSMSSRKTYSGLVATARKNGGIITQKSTNFTLAKRCMSADHSKLWPIEKLVTLGLIGVVPATFIAASPNVILDDAFAILTVLHMHWGLEGCVVDYVRPIILGNAIPKLTLGLLYLFSFATLGGLLFYNHECTGIGCTIKQIWQIEK